MRHLLFVLSVAAVLVPLSCSGNEDQPVNAEVPGEVDSVRWPASNKEAAKKPLTWDEAKEALVVYLLTEKGEECADLKYLAMQLLLWRPDSVDIETEKAWFADWHVGIRLNDRAFSMWTEGPPRVDVAGTFQQSKAGPWKAVLEWRKIPIHRR
jgi:hypothetical protein